MEDFDELARQALNPPSQGQVIPFPRQDTQFEDLASQVMTMQRQASAGTALTAQQGGADATARALSASRTTGIPMPSAEANPEAADAAAQTEKNGAILFQNPKLAQFMGANPVAARMAQDEFDHLDSISKITAAVSDGAKSAMLQNRMGRLGTVKEMAEMVLGRASPETDQQIEAIEQQLAKSPQMHGALGFIHSVSGFVTGLVDNIAEGGEKGAAIGAVVGGGAGAAVGGVGAIPGAFAGGLVGATQGTYLDASRVAAGNTYLRLSRLTGDTGQPISDAGKIFGSLFAGASTYALFKYQGDIEQKLFGDTADALVAKAIDTAVTRPTFQAAFANVAKATAAGATRGGVSMGVLEASNIIAEQAAKAISPGHFATDPAEMVQRIADATVDGAVLFGAMHAAGAGMGMYGDLRNAQRAEEQMQMFQGLQDAAGKAKLRSRDLQSFQDFMHSQLQGEPGDSLFIPAAKVLELYQGARIDPDVSRGTDPLFGFVKDMPEQLREAASTGGDVVIPTADFVTHLAGTPISEKLMPDMRIGAEAMSVNEAKIYAKEWGNRGKEALEAAAKVKPEATDLIARDIQQQAEAAGSPRAEAGRYAQIAAARYATRAERLGVSVADLYKQEPIQIRFAEEPTGGLQQSAIERSKNLTPAQQAIETRFAGQVEGNPAKAIQDYSKLPDTHEGKILNTDTARELSPDYLADRTQAAAVHEPASWLIKQIYAKKLAEKPKPGEVPAVLFTAGGTGAGKSSAIATVPELKNMADGAQIIYDTNMNTYGSAKSKIDQALKAGKNVQIALVVRDPVDALVNGALPRAMRQEGKFGSGRTVPIEEHVKTHVGAIEVVKRLAKEYAGNAQVRIFAVDNGLGAGKAKLIDLSKVADLSYNEVAPKVKAALESERTAGRISESVYEGFKGTPSPLAGSREAVGGVAQEAAAGIRGQPERQGAAGATGRPPAAPAESLAQSGARGSIRFEHGAKIISLFAESDHSTLIHESGHAWLEELMADAQRQEAPQGLKDDAQATLKWLGVQTADQIGTAQHEQFARAAEAYFMEGKTPSRGLAAIFSRFKEWLTRIYQSVSQLDTPINPEIRGVFDRLLATDEEIADARKTQGLEPVFRDRQSAGMTSAEWRSYLSKVDQAKVQAESTMLEKMMAKIRRERTAEYKEESAPIRAEVTRQVDSQPDMQAMRAITRGELSDGTKGDLHISREIAQQMYGRDIANLPRGVLSDKGLHPDEIAELVGYGSGDEMMRALMSLEQRQREIRATDGEKRTIRQYLIDEGVRSRMEETTSEESIRAEAMAAVNGERAQELQALELRYLNRQAVQGLVERGKGRKAVAEAMTEADWAIAEADLVAKLDKAKGQAQIEKLQEQIKTLRAERRVEVASERQVAAANRAAVNVTQPILESLRAHADAIIEGKTADELSRGYFKWARDERKAAREVEEALLKDDFQAAAAAKQRQLLAGIMFSKARDANAYVEKSMKTMDSLSARAKFEGISQPFTDQLHALLSRFGFDVNRDQNELARAIGTITLSDFVQDRFNDGYELPITPMIASSGQPAGSLRMAQFRELAEFVDAMRNAGREEQVVRSMGQIFDRKEAVREMVEALGKLNQREKGEYLYPEDRGVLFAKAQQAASFMRSMNASLLKKEAVFDWADAGQIDGPFNRYIFRPLKDASHKEMTLRTEAVDSIRALEKSLPKGWAKRLNETIATTLIDPESGNPTKMTRKRLLSLALNWGTEDNATKLANGYGWNQRDIQQLLDHNMSKEDWQFVQGIWNMFEKYREPVDQLQRRVSGVGIEYVSGRGVGTPHGEIEGKYFPLYYDAGKSIVAERDLERSRDALFENQYGRATTHNGSVISRLQGVKLPVNLSLDLIPWKIGQTIHDLSFREALMQADKLLSDKNVIAALDSGFSPEVRKTMRPWLQHIANVDNINDRATAWLDKFLNSARSNATMLGIGFRATTAIKHGFSALSQTVTELGPRWAMRGFMESYGTPQQMKRNWAFALENSQELKFRPQMYDRDLQANADRWITDGIAKRINSDLQHYGHFLVSYLDFGSAVPAWLGAYRKATESLGMEHKEASYYADKAVRNAHGAQSIVDRAAIQDSKNQLVKMSTMFYGFLNHMYNRGVVYPSRLAGQGMEQMRAGETGKAVRNFAEVAARTTGYLVVPGIVAGMVTKGPSQDEGWWHWAAEAVLHETAATVPIVRDIANAALNGYDYEPTPLVRMVKTIMGSAKDIFSAMGLREKDPSRKALRHFLETVGYMFGTPTGQAATTLQFLWDVNDGRADPQSLSDWLHGLAKGDVPKEH